MEKLKLTDLPPVARTLLIPLAYRAIESGRPDALLRDERALELAGKFDQDFTRLVTKKGLDQTATLMRTRQFDRYARALLAVHPAGAVVDIGCGLDTRFDRLDNGQMRWYGLDLPEVIALRQQLLPTGPRCTLIGRSVLDFAWMEVVAGEPRPVIFLAEGVLPYFDEADVKGLMIALAGRFPGSEFVFDVLTPASIRMHSLDPGLRKSQAHLGWGLDRSAALEEWGAGLRLLEEWRYFDQDEPRLRGYNWMRHIPLFARANRILRYGLGFAG